MPDWQHFTNAPIEEALLDIQAELSSDVTLQDLANPSQILQEQFPRRRERMFLQGELELAFTEGSSNVRTSSGPDGYLFASDDGKRIVQMRLDGFTYNRLRPYDSWSAFRAEAEHCWGIYKNTARPVSIGRLALRYVNKLRIPVPFELKDYLRTGPEISVDLKLELEAIFVRVVSQFPEFDCIATITEATERVDAGILTLVFDVDVFKPGPFAMDEGNIWRTFENLREAKNKIFFESITPKAEELFR